LADPPEQSRHSWRTALKGVTRRFFASSADMLIVSPSSHLSIRLSLIDFVSHAHLSTRNDAQAVSMRFIGGLCDPGVMQSGFRNFLCSSSNSAEFRAANNRLPALLTMSGRDSVMGAFL
jgi:hypothetical protein